jgi:phage portal protein BeeE
MANSAILDRHGQPMVMKSTAPNLDPDFWLTDNDSNATVKNSTTMPYAYHVWVYKCVSVIAQNVSQICKHLQEKKSGATIDMPAVLALLARPNQLMTQDSFFRMIVCQLLLPATKGGITSGGQSFIIPWNTVRDSKVRLDKGEIPNELFPYPETYFKPWYGSENNGRAQVKGWTFSISQLPGSEINFEHGEIIRINQLNPYDILKGMSPFSPVATAVELDAKADIFNSDIFANSGRLDGQVSSEQFIDASELSKVKEEWYKQYTGPRRKRVAFLSGGLKFEQYALSSVDLQYIEQEKWSRQKVLGAYGQNRIGVGDYEDINFATIREGRKMLWYDTYIPMDKMVLDSFNGQWVSYIERGRFVMSSDYTKIPALQSDMQDRAKTGGILVTQMGYPPSLASRIVELPLRLEDIEKWPHLDNKIEQASPAFGAPSAPDDTDEKAKMVSKNMKRDYSSNYIDKSLDPGEKYFKRDLDKYFVGQRNRILDKVDEWVGKQKKIKGGPGSGRYPAGSGEDKPEGDDSDGESGGGSSGGSSGPSGHDISDSEFNNTGNDIHSKLNEDELNAVQNYQTISYDEMNRNLRKGKELSEDDQYDLPHIDSAISKATGFTEDVNVYRGMNVSPSKLTEGTTFEDKGFISTSTDRKIANLYADKCMVQIVIPKGSKCLPLSSKISDSDSKREKEVMLPRGSKFRVVSAGEKITINSSKTTLIKVVLEK